MKKIITMTHFDRPLYTDLCMKHLLQCKGIEEYRIISYVEPSDTQVYQVLCEYLDKLYMDVILNSERKFNSKNIHAAMSHGFSLTDYVIHVEDDIMLAKDALSFFEWAKNQKSDDIVNVCSYVRRTNDRDCDVWQSYHKVTKRRWFVPWGWATWKDRFDKMCELNLWNDDPGFDININKIMNGYELCPHISRSQNIGGVNGFHIESSQWHYMHQFTPVWIESYDLIKHYLPEGQWTIK